MAFVLLPDLDRTEPQVERRGSTLFAITELATDPDDDRSLLLEVCLAPHTAGGVELVFFLSIQEGETGDLLDTIFDGRRTRYLAPDLDRKAINDALLASVAALVASEPPDLVFFCAMEVIPEKAEIKYMKIAEVLEGLGYRVRNADSYHGRRAWWAHRLVEQ